MTTAKERNNFLAKNFGDDPPYWDGTKVFSVTLKEETSFVRFYGGGAQYRIEKYPPAKEWFYGERNNFMIQVIEKTLIVGGEKIEFSKPIKEILEIEDIVIVLLETVGTLDDFNNIYALKNKSFLWQVQDFLQYLPSVHECPEMNIGSYVSIHVDVYDTNKILATTFSGHVFSIEILNGMICKKITWVK